MTGLDMTVCLKVVPRPEEIRINPEARTLDRAAARSFINPADMNALETALALKDRHGGQIRLLAMGPPLFGDYLRVALAMGADVAYLLSDRAFGGADTLATSYTLSRGIRKMGRFDLIICGEESSDGATAQVPPGIAEWLEIPQVTYATHVELEPRSGQLRAKRELRAGYEIVLTPLPALVSVRVGANEPRFMDMNRLGWVRTAPLTVWGARDLDADLELVGAAGSPTVVTGTHELAKRERRREMIAGSPEEQAHALAAKIRPQIVALRAVQRGQGASSAH